MDEKKRDTVNAWLVKAQRDLNVAQKLSSDEEPHLDAAIYHCQQAAEKAIKAYLVFQNQRFEKNARFRSVGRFSTTIRNRFFQLDQTRRDAYAICNAISLPRRFHRTFARGI